MTAVAVDLRYIDPVAGTSVPATGRIEVSPVFRYHVNTDDDHIVVPYTFDSPLTAGKATLLLAPTVPVGEDGPVAYQIKEALEQGNHFGYYVVPDDETVDYGDLVEVNYGSFQPTAVPEDAWWVALAEIEAAPGTPGPEGPEGPRGIQGEQGLPGIDGTDGLDGLDGENGEPGAKGDKGDKGDPGTPGADGADGQDGAQGIQGVQGEPGTPGADGEDGAPGAPGADGADGESVTVTLVPAASWPPAADANPLHIYVKVAD